MNTSAVWVRLLVLCVLALAVLPARAANIVYPDPEQVKADITDPVKRAAALYIITRAINNHGYSQEVANQFQKALQEVDPPFPFEQHIQFVKQYDPLTHDPNFTFAVVKKYLPFLASRVDGELREQVAAQESAKLGQKIHTAGTILFYTMLGVPLIFLAWPWRVWGHKPKIPDDIAGPLRFPDELRRAKVFRKSFPLAFECGQIFDINEWTETSVSHSTQPGRQYTVGDTTYIEQGTTTTHYSSVKYHKYWLNRPDGQKVWSKFEDNVFLANRGNIISIVDAAGYIMFAYNHTTGNFIHQRWCWTKANRYPGRWVWLATVAAIGAVTYALGDYMAADYAREMTGPWSKSIGMAMIVYGVIAGFYVLIVKHVVQAIRNFQFRRKYEKPIQEFMRSCTPYLEAHEYPLIPPTEARAGRG